MILEKGIQEWLTYNHRLLAPLIEAIKSPTIFSKLARDVASIINNSLITSDKTIFTANNIYWMIAYKHHEFHVNNVLPLYSVLGTLSAVRYQQSFPADHPFGVVLSWLDQFVIRRNRYNPKSSTRDNSFIYHPKTIGIYLQFIFGIDVDKMPKNFGKSRQSWILICDRYEKDVGKNPFYWPGYRQNRPAKDMSLLFHIQFYTNKRSRTTDQATESLSSEDLVEASKGTIFETNINEVLFKFKSLQVQINTFWRFCFEMLSLIYGTDDNGQGFNTALSTLKMDVIDRKLMVILSDPVVYIINAYGKNKPSYDFFIDSIGSSFLNDAKIMDIMMKEHHVSVDHFERFKILVSNFISVFDQII
jgi:hypothetical protein